MRSQTEPLSAEAVRDMHTQYGWTPAGLRERLDAVSRAEAVASVTRADVRDVVISLGLAQGTKEAELILSGAWPIGYAMGRE